MFLDFVSKLKPVFKEDNREFNNLLEIYKQKFLSRQPVLFWYPSSGFDLKALVYFNEKDTSQIYKTPSVDIFVYSDYWNKYTKEFMSLYENFETGSNILFRDCKTNIELTQIIPLNFFSEKDVTNFSKEYKNYLRCSSLGNLVNEPQFWFFLIEIDSCYFGHEYFPVLFCSIENRFLRDNVWKKYGIKFDYICGITDGCRKGGNNECINKNYRDYFPVMKKEKYWITDHFPSGIPESFLQLEVFRNWGFYMMPDDFLSKKKSYLFKIKE